MLRHPLLKRHLLAHFGAQARQLPNTVFIPLGDKVAEALDFLAAQGVISPQWILGGLPHPSGANAERIAYFLGNKDKKALSEKTDPTKLDQAKAKLLIRMQRLMASATADGVSITALA